MAEWQQDFQADSTSPAADPGNEASAAAVEAMGLDARPAEGWPNYSTQSTQPEGAVTAPRPPGLDVDPAPASGVASGGSPLDA